MPGRTYERVNLKPTVKMLELEKRSKDEPTPASDLAPVLFKRKEASRVVAGMISVIEDSLIKGRTPELRVQVIIKKFIEHPDIRKVLRFMDQSASTLSASEQTARDGIIRRLGQALADCKNSNSTDGRLLRQTLLNICAPEKNSNLLRATARVLNLKSCKGLVAGQLRVLQYRAQIDADGDGLIDSESDGDIPDAVQEKKILCRESPWVPPERKTRSGVLSETQKILAQKTWHDKTRPTANRKNIAKRDGKMHPVHWLEDTEFNFYRAHLKAHNLYFTDQLLVRGVSKSTHTMKLRSVFTSYGEIVSIKIFKKYAYVCFKHAESAKAAVAAAGRGGRALEVNEDRVTTEVTFRPLIGFRKFQQERPFYVKPVCQATCVCQTCHGMRLLFDAFMRYDRWDVASPEISELIHDIKRAAGSLSPTVELVLELLMCEADPDSEYLKKSCCFGECKQCRLDEFFEKAHVQDEEKNALAGQDGVPLHIKYGSYKNVELEALDKEGKPRTKLVVSTSELPPSEFVELFRTSLRLHATHKFIACHQSSRRAYLKANMDADAKAWEMDFGENYEIIFGIEVQSEHWSHSQVTLFIIISHELDEDGELLSVANVVISSDLKHGSEAVQHYFASILGTDKKKFKVHWVDTDGAASHFKNRFTFQFICELKDLIGATILAWETCAPGHGKGPWDGLCAVIKSWLRRYEIQRKTTCARDTFSPRGVFEVLRARQVDWVAQLHDRNTINMISFWYVPVLGEDCPPGPNVLGPVPRARSRPCVTSIAGIRTHFFFLAIDATTMWMRKLSCHCEECRHGEFKKCGNDAECGAWQVKILKSNATAPVSLRSMKSALAAKRRNLARAGAAAVLRQLLGPSFDCRTDIMAIVTDVLALESADNELGFHSGWRLSRVRRFNIKGN